MSHGVRRYVAMFAVGVLALAVGCSSDGGGIGATEADFSITLDTNTAAPGDVTFDVKNEASQTHEFVVMKTDLAEDALPTDDAGDITEDSPDITVVDEIEDIAAGSSPSLTVNLEAGSYVIVCNLPGHYRQGMHAAFTVA